MVVANKQDLISKINQYCQAGQFETARRFARQYSKQVGAVQEEMEFLVVKAEQAANAPQQPVQPAPAQQKDEDKKE